VLRPLRVRLVVLFVGLLAVVASVPITSTTPALAASYSPTTPMSRTLQVAPARLVNLQGLMSSATISYPNASMSFLPKDQASHAAAQQLANQGKTGRSTGVVAVPRATSKAAGSAAPQIQQQLAGFPVMDLSRQIVLYGTTRTCHLLIRSWPRVQLTWSRVTTMLCRCGVNPAR